MTQEPLPIYPDHQWVLDILDKELKVGNIINLIRKETKKC